jgi:nitroreductase
MSQVLDLARWAPSGDNTQPWRFEVVDQCRLVIHGFDTRDHCVYDLDGHASQLSVGALIETLVIAGTNFSLRVEVKRRPGLPDTRPTFDITLVPDESITPSPLIASIPLRSVQRRPFQSRPLRSDDKQLLENSLSRGYRLRWLEGWGPKWQAALLMFRNAKLRLTIEEAYNVHKSIIEWGQRYSVDRVPDQSLGADKLTLLLMRWAMRDWQRVVFLNRWLAGTWAPRLKMDLLPGLMCGAHMVLLRDEAPCTVDDYIESGREVQRLWLTATKLGLQHQPELTPLIFSRYVREQLTFSSSEQAGTLARDLATQTSRMLETDLTKAVWIGRIGHGASASSRSLRRSREELSRADAIPS